MRTTEHFTIGCKEVFNNKLVLIAKFAAERLDINIFFLQKEK